MTNFTKFEKANFKDVRDMLETAFADIEKQTGIKLAIGHMKFGETSFSTTLNGVLSASVSDPMLEGVEPKWISDFKRYAEFTGCLLRRVEMNGKPYVVVGLHGRTKFVMREDKPDSKLVTFRFEIGDRVYCKVTNKPYNPAEDYSRT